jgi:ArsR family transcriptional regulator, arsenate/arsenite/antimonite-responsive transcriptional repressor
MERMAISEDQFAKILKAISEPKRLDILHHVAKLQGEDGTPCSQVLPHIDVSQSTFSHHVCELKDAGLLIAKPEGRCVMLSVDSDLFDAFQEKLRKSVLL